MIVFLICKIAISTSKKTILDINNWFWMAAYGDISQVEIQLLISRIQFLISKM